MTPKRQDHASEAKMDLNGLRSIKKDCFRTLLEMYKRANAGHIGASLSCLDLLIFLHFLKATDDEAVILSKGHAAGALYVVLEAAGKIPKGSTSQFYRDGTHFAAHPPCNREFKAIPFGTGSLGHGLGLATGIAYANRLKGNSKKTYVLLSDGELNEGSIWESLMFACHHQLSNLVVIIDQNGLQGLGGTKDIMNLDPLDEKFKSFGAQVHVISNGNLFESIAAGFQAAEGTVSRPTILIAKTTKGSGVSFMENRFEWHYLPMNDEQFAQAMKESERDHA